MGDIKLLPVYAVAISLSGDGEHPGTSAITWEFDLGDLKNIGVAVGILFLASTEAKICGRLRDV